MFRDCSKLEYINLNNFDNSKIGTIYYMFDNLPKNAVICLKEIDTQSKILLKFKSHIRCAAIDCTDDWRSKQKKIINETNQCIESCDKSLQYPYEYNGICYENCQNGYLYDENNNKMNICRCEIDECLLCPKESLILGLCTKCNSNYYPKENDPLNAGKFIKCYKELNGFYLDSNLFKQCYFKCKTCNISGSNITHNCLKCNDNYPIEINYNNYFNCYQNCSYYYYFDEENNYHCTLNFSCPDGYSKLNEDKMKCKKIEVKNFMKEIEKYILNKEEEMTKKEEVEYYDNLIKMIEIGFTENYETIKLDNGQDEYIEAEKMAFILATLENQKNDINNDMITIDLGECENLLRNYYNISNNEALFIKKIIVPQEGYKIPKVEYDIYSKLFGINLIKLNITVCGNRKIKISIPIELTENLDKLNCSSGYYNNICYTTTSEYGTDITLKERNNIFVDKNMTVCQEECEFSKYDDEKLKVECSCKVKKSSSSITDIKINKDKLFENFKDIRNIANLNFLLCYKLLLQKDGIINNIGCYLTLAIILFHIITIFIFYINDLSVIKKKIKQLILEINENPIISKKEKVKKYESKNSVNKISIIKKDKKKKGKKKHNIKHINSKNDFSKWKIIPKNNKININNEKIINLPVYTDEEINELSYDLALQYDKRVYCQYYNSLIKTKHNLIFAFCNNSDYNSKIIKIDLFFIGFAIEYIVNALFYNDDTMHKIYQSKGEFDLEYQLPIIVYSTLISMILNSPLNFLSLSNDAIINFKQNKSTINIKKKAKKLETKLKIKFVFYFIIGFIFLCCFWYYIDVLYYI